MNLWAVLGILISAANVDVTLAPDQPLPYVYVDDPLLVELRAAVDGSAEVNISVQASHQAAQTAAPVIQTSLRARGAQWLAVEGVPAERGYYTLRARITLNGVDTEWSGHFCRIDRDAGETPLPVRLYGIGTGGTAAHALRAIQVKGGIFMLAQNGAAEQMEAAAKAGFTVAARIDAGALKDAVARTAEWAPRFSGQAVRWVLDTQGDAALLDQLVKTIRSAGSNAPITVVVPASAMFRRYLEQGSGASIQGTVLERADQIPAQVEAIRALASLAGYEDWPIYVSLRTAQESLLETGDQASKQLLSALAAGAVEVALPSEAVLRGELREPAVCLSGLAHRYVAGRFRGRVDAGPHVEALLFRDGGRWLLALWSDNGAREALIDLSEAKDLKWTDALNNPLELPESGKDGLHLPVDERVRVLSGSGGVFLARAALAEAQILTKQFASNETFKSHLPGALMEIVGLFAQQAGGASSRPNFLAMIRSFPSLERDWHEGAVPEYVAALAIAQLARIARELCTVEQQSGLPFLDPLQDTLARCSEYQSLYLTSSAGTGATCERGDWILDETRRLVEEAQDLAEAERRIEAAAVASLAEWRSRSLEFAATAKTPKPLAAETAAPPETSEIAGAEAKEAAEKETAAARKIHRATRGDTPGGIVRKYGIKLSDFRKWNGLPKNARLKDGKDYFIAPPAEEGPATPETAPQTTSEEKPKAAEEKPPAQAAPEEKPKLTETAPEPKAPPAEPPSAGKRETHTVVRGDNPSVIAKKYKIKLDDFLKWNKLTSKARFQLGEVYVIEPPSDETTERTIPDPAPAPELPSEEAPAKDEAKKAEPAKEEPKPEPEKDQPKEAPASKKHTVKKGDIPAGIAKQYGISTEDFFKWNKMSRSTPLRIGKTYWVKSPDEKDAVEKKDATEPEKKPEKKPEKIEAPAESATPGTHLAKPGDTAQSVAKQYGISLQDFYRWNHFKRGQSVQPGQKYKVSGGN